MEFHKFVIGNNEKSSFDHSISRTSYPTTVLFQLRKSLGIL